MSVSEFYDKRADDYLKRMNSGFLKRIRQRELASVIKNLNPVKDDKILDAGAGAGYYAKFIAENYNPDILCVDISPRMVDNLRSLGLNAIVGDIEKLNLGDQRFNKILCLGVLEFCKDPSLALRNLTRYLHKEGFILILVPPYSILGIALFFYHLIQRSKIRLFSNKKIREILYVNNLHIETMERPYPISLLIKARRLR
ncbi:MAG: hypothetical protein Fur0020_00290 [Thermodesulfovibrionia bacterium]